MSSYEDVPARIPSPPTYQRRTFMTAGTAMGLTAAVAGNVACSRTSSNSPSASTLSKSFVVRRGSRLFLADRPWRPVGVNLPWSFGWGGAKCPSDAEHDKLFETLLPGSIFRLWAFGNWPPERIRQLVDRGRHYGHKFVLTLADYHGDISGEHWVHSAGSGSTFIAGEWKRRGGWRDSHLMPMLEMFAEDSAVCLWEPINEPDIRHPRLAPFFCEVSSLVRENAPKQLLGTGTASSYGHADWMHRLNQLTNVDVASMHEYDELQAPSRWTAGDVQVAAAEGKPLIVGESGVTTRRAGSAEARADLIRSKIKAASQVRGLAAYIYWSAAAAKSVGPLDYEISCSGGPEIHALAQTLV